MSRRLPTARGLVVSLGVALACLAWTWPTKAHARRFFRARFEPTTLELEAPGRLEFDLQMGGLHGDGQDGDRLVLPDFEVDLGLLSWLELDVDGGFSLIHVDEADRSMVGEPLWTSAKVAIVNVENETTGATFGAGLQLGPRLPSLRTAHRVGFAALFLLGGGSRDVHVVANFGGVLDRGQSAAMVYGIDVDVSLGPRRAWALIGELGGAHYFGASSPEQLIGTLGVSYQASPSVGLSLIVLGGFLPGNDRVGALAGLATTFGVWKP